MNDKAFVSRWFFALVCAAGAFLFWVMVADVTTLSPGVKLGGIVVSIAIMMGGLWLFPYHRPKQQLLTHYGTLLDPDQKWRMGIKAGYSACVFLLCAEASVFQFEDWLGTSVSLFDEWGTFLWSMSFVLTFQVGSIRRHQVEARGIDGFTDPYRNNWLR